MHAHTHAYVYTHILSFIRSIIHILCWAHIHNPFDIYTGAFSSIQPVPEVQVSRAKLKLISLFFFLFPSSFQFFLTGYQFHLHSPPRHKSKGTWRKFTHANVFHHTMYVPYIFIYVCCHEYRMSQVKKTLCFSNTVLCGDWLSFCSGGSVSGLWVHRSVRYNYGKLIPGKPVWHSTHDVSCSYLIHSFLRVQSHMCTCTHTNTHFLCIHTTFFRHMHAHTTCWQFHEFGNCPGRIITPIYSWFVCIDTCTSSQTYIYTHKSFLAAWQLSGVLMRAPCH